MPARLPLVGETSRQTIYIYDDDRDLINRIYGDFGLSGFVRELVHRHCESARTAEAKKQQGVPSGKPIELGSESG